MRVRLLFVAAFVLAPALVQAGPYEDCILQNMKGVQAQAAAGAVMRACKEKTTPKKCRGEITGASGYVFEDSKEKVVIKAAPGDSGYTALQDRCIRDCADASYWSRTFGECSTD